MTAKPPVIPPEQVLLPMNTAKEPYKRADRVPPPKDRHSRKYTRDRFTLLNSFVDFSLASVPRTDAAVWLVLYRDTRDGIARTAQSDIAQRAGVGKRTVVRAIKRLQERGLLTVVFRGGLNRGISSYRVNQLCNQEP